MPIFRSSFVLVAGAVGLALAALPLSAAAQMRGDPFGRSAWGSPYGSSRLDRDWRDRRQQSREGQVTAEQFKADGADDLLGAGVIRVQVLPDSSPQERERLDYEAAMLDRLGAAGYDISGSGTGATQVAQIRVVRDVAEPAEERRSPVSGEGSVMVSNRGSAMGLAVNVDLTEPRKALMATRMDLRIIDQASGDVLWEGRASMLTRDQDEDWDSAAIANRLAAALLEGFPARGG
jgi:hypothetical protein